MVSVELKAISVNVWYKIKRKTDLRHILGHDFMSLIQAQTAKEGLKKKGKERR